MFPVACTPKGSTPGGASANWWEVAGQTCVAAYQPKGAANLAASYVNLANPGTYDAAPGTAPAFDTATGWDFNGSSTWLATGVVPTVDYSILVRLSDNGTTSNYVAGVSTAGGVQYSLRASEGFGSRYYINVATLSVAGEVVAGVLGMAGKAAYLDGTGVGTIGAGTATWSSGLLIGAYYLEGFGPAGYSTAKIQAVAIYSTTLSASDVAALTTAMNAL